MRRSSAVWARAIGVLVVLGGASARAEGPSYHRDVAPILRKNCQDCHRPGQVAPFPLLTYEQARKRAADLARVTSDRQMPPWPASTEVGGPFRDERTLSDPEVATLRAWSDAGAPEGDPADAPADRTFSSEWPLGEPDLILTMAESYTLEPSGDDEFRVFVLPTDLPADRWVRAVDFRPGNRRVVHHVIAAIDTSGKGREKDQADPSPGYHAVGGFGQGVPIRDFLPVWTPGTRPRMSPEGAGYLLPRGADVLIQVHYHKDGKPEEDATAIGLYFSDQPLAKRLRTGVIFPDVSLVQALKARTMIEAAKASGRQPSFDEMMHEVLTIPAGDPNYEVRATAGGSIASRPLSRDVLLTSVMPHMHWLGKDIALTAVKPDGTRVPLIRIDRWDFNWQGTYAFVEPIPLPKGTTLEMIAHFDNSADNPANPSSPPRTVTWGDQTNDEMCLGLYEFMNVEEKKPAPAPTPAGGD